MNAPASEPAYSIVRNRILVAYVWPSTTGQLRRAGRSGATPLCSLNYAEIHCFDPNNEQTLQTLAQKATDLETLFFDLGVEGFEVSPGAFHPNQRTRRF